MKTAKPNPAVFRLNRWQTLLMLVLFPGLHVLTGCNPEEDLAPEPAPAVSVSDNLVRSFENLTVYRMELRITTANVEDAGTDDGVYVQLNRADRGFYLSKAIDDFERNRAYTYDLLSEEVKKVRNITHLTVGLRGDDGVAFKRLELFLNGNRYPVFVKEFSGSGRWLDNSQSFTIPGAELRRHAGWRFTPQHNNMDIPPAQISSQMIASLVECSIGNKMNYMDGLGWGDKRYNLFGPAVEVSYVNNRTLHFDLDLKHSVRFGPDPELDVDFDLEFSCDNGIIKTQMKNLKYDSDWMATFYQWLLKNVPVLVGGAIGSSVGAPGEGAAAGALLAKVLEFDFKPELPTADPTIYASCQQIRVSTGGAILLRQAAANAEILAER